MADFEEMRAIRVRRARRIFHALESYDNGELDEDLTDLIADALYQAARLGIDAEALAARALSHFLAERR